MFCLQQGQLQFEDKWPSMRPTVLKLLRQEPVNRGEWQDLFWWVSIGWAPNILKCAPAADLRCWHCDSASLWLASFLWRLHLHSKVQCTSLYRFDVECIGLFSLSGQCIQCAYGMRREQPKFIHNLQDDILDFIKQAQSVCNQCFSAIFILSSWHLLLDPLCSGSPLPESIIQWGRFCPAQGLHSRMGQVLYSVRLPTKAFPTARDHSGWQSTQLYAKEKPGRWNHSQKADAGQLESEHLLQYQTASTGQCDEAGACRAQWRGLWLTACHWSAGIIRWVPGIEQGAALVLEGCCSKSDFSPPHLQ